MKRIKKMLSIILTMAMALSMTATVFAAGEEDAASTPAAIQHTYEIFQIFTGDYSDGVLSNVKWGKNGQGTEGVSLNNAAGNNAILNELEAINGKSDTEKLEVIKKYVNFDTTPIETKTAEGNGKVEVSGLASGYYIVRDKADSMSSQDNGVYTLYVVQVVNNVLEITPKGDVPTVSKNIVESDNSRVETNEASIGDTVNYEIIGTMPSNIDQYKEYYYRFSDTLSKGLTVSPNSIKVTVNDVDVTDWFYKDYGTYNETTGTNIEVSVTNLKNLKNKVLAVGEITKDTKVVLTYSATLNENAVIAGEGNPNTVKLTYSNDPNNSGNGETEPDPDNPNPSHPTGETPEDKVVTFTTELTILKTIENTINPLPGAEFTLTGEGVNIVLITKDEFVEADDGEYWMLADGESYTKEAPITEAGKDNTADYKNDGKKYKKTTTVVAKGNGKNETKVVGVIGADGTVTFRGLGAGTYTIEETKVPAGYNKAEDITFTLSFDKDTKKFSSNNDKVTVGDDNMLDTQIKNFKGSTLPSTGGIGTTIFYIIGAILVVGAAILLVTKKRMSKEA